MARDVFHEAVKRALESDLISMGVSKGDIVLGFQMPFKRKFSGFATG